MPQVTDKLDHIQYFEYTSTVIRRMKDDEFGWNTVPSNKLSTHRLNKLLFLQVSAFAKCFVTCRKCVICNTGITMLHPVAKTTCAFHCHRKTIGLLYIIFLFHKYKL